VNKSNFTRIKCADKERFKTWPKRVQHKLNRIYWTKPNSFRTECEFF